METILPQSEAELADEIRQAASSGQTFAVRGGGTRNSRELPVDAVLSTRALSGVSLYEPGALTLVVKAGTPVRDVEALLAAEKQHLAFEPWDPLGLSGRNGTPTVGGMAAVNASGPRRIKAGACRDAMLGVRFVDGSGTVIKNGGRVMKNVTGLDLVKLLAGSHGTLGVMTEVAFRVQPRPEVTASVVLDGLDLATASAAMIAALGTPYDVSGAAHLPDGPEGAPMTVLRLEGLEGSVRHRVRELAAVLRRFGPTRTLEGGSIWESIRDASGMGARTGALWRISVRPGDGARLASILDKAEVLLDWAGGLLWVLASEDHDIRAAMAGIPGHATLVRGDAETRARWGVFHPEPEPVAALSTGLRARFDPAGVFNPGLMGDARQMRVSEGA
ncbi:FAD-binding protein [Amaricoccus macauensis]|uniref:FAD-binding protein n=1 Tax=Amaricoccus macauensis TaxID=57001 RepID=UPI003C7E4996